ncbi:MAG TPA: YezD family protein [Methylotenera sp.]|nr:YezD family protein [Methylotenera sp.]
MSLNQSTSNFSSIGSTITGASKTSRDDSSDVSQEILRAVESLRQGSGFGSIEIVLHEGRVTQIEKREKLRFKQDSTKSNPTAQAATK